MKRVIPAALVFLAIIAAGCQDSPDRVAVHVKNTTSESGVLYVNVTQDIHSSERFQDSIETEVGPNEALDLGVLELPAGYYNLTVEFRNLRNVSVIYTKQIGVDFLDAINITIDVSSLRVEVTLQDGRTLPHSTPP